MGLFDFFKSVDINKEIAEYGGTPGAILLDVRTAQEYREGHIPGSINMPLQSIAEGNIPGESMNVPLYVYCYSGSRSRQAVGLLRGRGYINAKNIGGISAYKGKVVR